MKPKQRYCLQVCHIVTTEEAWDLSGLLTFLLTFTKPGQLVQNFMLAILTDNIVIYLLFCL